MKRTTYIIIGALLATVCLLVGGVCFLFSLGEVRSDNFYIVGGQPVTLQLPACKAVVVGAAGAEGTVSVPFHFVGETGYGGIPLTVTTASAEVPSITFASDMQKHCSTCVQGDTLYITFSFPASESSSDFLKVRTAPMTLALPAGFDRVAVDVHTLYPLYKDMVCGNFTIDRGNSTVENCRFDTLFLKRTHGGKVQLESGAARVLHVDCDLAHNWSVNADSFDIDTEYLTGSSRTYTNRLQTGECRRLVWAPKPGTEASLNVVLHQPGELVLE